MRRVWLMLAVLAATPLWASTSDVYPFDSAAEQERFSNLITELRCPKCQNQNIADSNSPISKDMRDEVYRMMQDGATNEEVTNALVSRFGEFVRYKPRLEQRTWLLWATPVLAVLAGLLVVAGIVLRSRRAAAGSPGLSAEEKARAERILGKDRGSH